MAFEKIPQQVYTAKIVRPPAGLFEDEQRAFLINLIKDIEDLIQNVYVEARRAATTDGNPQRNVVNLNGASGSISVDLKQSQLSHGIPVLVFADALGGNVTITNFSNSYNWTMVWVINEDSSNTITIQENSNILLDTGADTVLNQHDMISLVQVNNAPLWLQGSSHITNA